MRQKGVWLVLRKVWVVALKRKNRVLRRRILIGRGRVILLMKLLKNVPKIGETTKGREKVKLMSRFLLCRMMSPLLDIWKEKESLLGDRKIKMLKRGMGIQTLLMMVNRAPNLMEVIVFVVVSGLLKAYLVTLVLYRRTLTF